MTLEFTVYGVALPKGNMRAFMMKGMKFPVVTESNRSVKSWQQLVQEGASHALNDLPASERTMLDGGVRLTVAFYLPRPKNLRKRGAPALHLKAPDLDKLLRAAADALQHVVYHDDKQIIELVAVKRYAPIDGTPRVDIRVEPTAGNKPDLLRDVELLDITRAGDYHERHTRGLAK